MVRRVSRNHHPVHARRTPRRRRHAESRGRAHRRRRRWRHLHGNGGRELFAERRGEAHRHGRHQGSRPADASRCCPASRSTPPRSPRSTRATRKRSASTASWCCRPWSTSPTAAKPCITTAPWPQATGLPIMVYNNPVSYGVDITVDMFGELADLANIVAIKESSEDTRRLTDLRRAHGERFVLFAGVDDIVLECLMLGASGWVSGLTNAFPRESVALFALAKAGPLRGGAGYLSLVHAAAASRHHPDAGPVHQARRTAHGPRLGDGARAAPVPRRARSAPGSKAWCARPSRRGRSCREPGGASAAGRARRAGGGLRLALDRARARARTRSRAPSRGAAAFADRVRHQFLRHAGRRFLRAHHLGVQTTAARARRDGSPAR